MFLPLRTYLFEPWWTPHCYIMGIRHYKKTMHILRICGLMGIHIWRRPHRLNVSVTAGYINIIILLSYRYASIIANLQQIRASTSDYINCLFISWLFTHRLFIWSFQCQKILKHISGSPSPRCDVFKSLVFSVQKPKINVVYYDKKIIKRNERNLETSIFEKLKAIFCMTN